jgi:hypothetical protein
MPGDDQAQIFHKHFRENVYENENFRENVRNTDIFVKMLDFREIFAKIFAKTKTFREEISLNYRFSRKYKNAFSFQP